MTTKYFQFYSVLSSFLPYSPQCLSAKWVWLQYLKQAWQTRPQLLQTEEITYCMSFSNPLTISSHMDADHAWWRISQKIPHTQTKKTHKLEPIHTLVHWIWSVTITGASWHDGYTCFSPLFLVLLLSDNLDAVCNVCCSRRLKLNEWYNQRCWDYREQNWCYLSNDVLFCGSEATNRREKWLPHSLWFYSLSSDRQIE